MTIKTVLRIALALAIACFTATIFTATTASADHHLGAQGEVDAAAKAARGRAGEAGNKATGEMDARKQQWSDKKAGMEGDAQAKREQMRGAADAKRREAGEMGEGMSDEMRAKREARMKEADQIRADKMGQAGATREDQKEKMEEMRRMKEERQGQAGAMRDAKEGEVRGKMDDAAAGARKRAYGDQ